MRHQAQSTSRTINQNKFVDYFGSLRYHISIICLDQWQRYENNPIVIQLETNHRQWSYGEMGITLFSDYIDNDSIPRIIKEH